MTDHVPAAGERVVLGRMSSAGIDRWIFVGSAVMALGIGGWALVTRPESRGWVLAVLVLMVLTPLAMVSRVWLEPAMAGRPAALVQKYLWRPATRVPMEEGARVEVVHRGPAAALEARGRSGRPVRVPLAVGGDSHQSRTPDELRALAAAVAAPGVQGGRSVGVLLQAQADHVEIAAPVPESPVFGGGSATWSALRPKGRRTGGDDG
ncbi:hypothetical protein JQN72_04310 [Phycicoccus sp. CSK15P-2]|uniref:hypothetical protein n=1 Tax=Phycicoccus sp. CSK15P-2 TaxID=2807627 RepID=UPI00194F4741|nr:hypothetical protein [Phycicoccus sp. CSK15P-2]MBM6403465.1 hypothetical protein [Phycicoccus sp. CSK15P-2]